MDIHIIRQLVILWVIGVLDSITRLCSFSSSPLLELETVPLPLESIPIFMFLCFLWFYSLETKQFAMTFSRNTFSSFIVSCQSLVILLHCTQFLKRKMILEAGMVASEV